MQNWQKLIVFICAILLAGCIETKQEEASRKTLTQKIVEDNPAELAYIAKRTADDIEMGSFVFQELEKNSNVDTFHKNIKSKAIKLRPELEKEKVEKKSFIMENLESLVVAIVAFYAAFFVTLGLIKNGKNYACSRKNRSEADEQR